MALLVDWALFFSFMSWPPKRFNASKKLLFQRSHFICYSREDLLAFAMAGANAWGLLLCTVMLGYGLVNVPRTLWKSANIHYMLGKLEFEAPKVKESVVDAESEVYEVTKVSFLILGNPHYELPQDISNANKKVTSEGEFRPLMDRLLLKCPQAVDHRGFEIDDETPDVITERYLISLHQRVKRAEKILSRNEA